MLAVCALLAWAGAGAAISVRAAGAPANPRAGPPNVVFILADDLGWRDLQCYGNDLVDTPNIDGLARSGLSFSQAYAYPTCSPTRVSLMTGSYPSRFGMALHINPHRRGWARLAPPPSPSALTTTAVSLADLVATRGYVSTLIGKWNIGYDNPYDLARVEMSPALKEEKSERVAFGFKAPPAMGTPGLATSYDRRLQEFARENPGKGLGPQTFQAVRFIEQNRDRPFFCFLSYHAVHVPMEVRKDLATKYWQRVITRNALPDPLYLGMIEAMDESVGLVLGALAELKLSENTVVIFASDNGGLIQDYYGAGPIVTMNTPLRGQKSTVWEGGIRVPFIVRWPGVVRPDTKSAEPILTTDLFPTLGEISGATLPANYSGDGVSLVPLFRGAVSHLEPRSLFWHQPAYMHEQCSPSSAVREGDYKLIEFLEDNHIELYNLADDLGEEHNLAEQKPDFAAALRAKLYEWRKKVGAEMPTVNPNYDPAKAQIWTVRPKKPWGPTVLEARSDLPDRYFTPKAIGP
jgi:uncharacterized sulfatase